tara:strand:+ start:6509 stop:7954 length:1446 start_codon:yes stop_codon:yes gene_type:complete
MRPAWLLCLLASFAFAIPSSMLFAATDAAEQIEKDRPKKQRNGGGKASARKGRSSGGSSGGMVRQPRRSSGGSNGSGRIQQPRKTPSRTVDKPKKNREIPRRRQVDKPKKNNSNTRPRVDKPRKNNDAPRRRVVDKPKKNNDSPRRRVDKPGKKNEVPRRRVVDKPRKNNDSPRRRVDKPGKNNDTPRRRLVDKPKKNYDKPRPRIDNPRRQNDGRRIGRYDRPGRKVDASWAKNRRIKADQRRRKHAQYKRWSQNDYRNFKRRVRTANRRHLEARRYWSVAQHRKYHNYWNPYFQRRNQWRSNWRRYHRRIVRNVVWDNIFYHSYWSIRYSRWNSRYYVVRPMFPTYPTYPIYTPIDYPEQDEWTFEDIQKVAYDAENLAHELYQILEEDSAVDDQFERELLSAMYDITEASQLLADAVQENYGDLQSSIYQLFHLEAQVLAAEKYIQNPRVSNYIQENFRMLKFYVDDLLWNYKVQWDD